MSLRDYFSVIKPGIVAGNLISVIGGFFLASRGKVDTTLLLATLTGIALVMASGCVFNNCIDRNLDRKMRRTRNRPMAQRRILLPVAIGYAILLGIAGFAILQRMTNVLTVLTVLLGFFIYVGLYSLYMKRHSRFGTWVGSLAGAVPPLAGYCAVHNSFDLGAFMLLTMFCLWQLPHACSIAILNLQDYMAAAIPVLPVSQGVPLAKKRMVGYVAAFTMAALLPVAGHYTGFAYFFTVLILGGYWLYQAWIGRSIVDDRRWARKLFFLSILMIMTVNVMMSVDFRPSSELPYFFHI